MRDLSWPLAMGIGGGVLTAYNLTHLLRRFLGTQEFQISTYLYTVSGLILLATIAAWIPARRAAGIEPIIALRAE